MQDQSTSHEFDHVACPVCDETRSEEIFLSKDYNYGVPGLFRYVKCSRCRFIYENPRPDFKRIMELYPYLYSTAVRDSYQSPETKINADVHRVRFKIIELFAPQGSRFIFDVGCGSGFFLEFMRRRGWWVSGIDPSREHIRYAKGSLGLKDIHCGLWPLDAGIRTQLDVVTLFHVIEHIPSPVYALSALKKVLRPGGIAVIETPNVESWPTKLFGSRWVTLDAPRHVGLFSKQTLRYCLEKAGFEPLMLKTFSPSTMEYTESIRYVLQDFGLRRYNKDPVASPSKSETETKKQTCGRFFYRKSLKRSYHKSEDLFFRGLNKLAALFDAGCNLLIVAQKPSTRKDIAN